MSCKRFFFDIGGEQYEFSSGLYDGNWEFFTNKSSDAMSSMDSLEKSQHNNP